MIRISPNEGKITVEEDAQGVFSRKSITEEDPLRCFKDSLRTADEGYHSGFLAAEYYLALSKRDGKNASFSGTPGCTPMFRSTIRPIPTSRSLVWYLAFRSIKRGKHPIAGLGWWRMKSRPRRHPCTTIHFPM